MGRSLHGFAVTEAPRDWFEASRTKGAVHPGYLQKRKSSKEGQRSRSYRDREDRESKWSIEKQLKEGWSMSKTLTFRLRLHPPLMQKTYISHRRKPHYFPRHDRPLQLRLPDFGKSPKTNSPTTPPPRISVLTISTPKRQHTRSSRRSKGVLANLVAGK